MKDIEVIRDVNNDNDYNILERSAFSRTGNRSLMNKTRRDYVIGRMCHHSTYGISPCSRFLHNHSLPGNLPILDLSLCISSCHPARYASLRSLMMDVGWHSHSLFIDRLSLLFLLLLPLSPQGNGRSIIRESANDSRIFHFQS